MPLPFKKKGTKVDIIMVDFLNLENMHVYTLGRNGVMEHYLD